MRYLTRATVALAAVVAAITLVSTALAVQPKKGGVELFGTTPMPGSEDYMFMKVAPSGTKLSLQLPALNFVGPPRLKNVKVSDAGRFSVTRELTQSGGYHAATEWTLKVSGTFTAPTKAKGTFSMKEIDPRGSGGTHKSGKQTFKLKFYK
jgi:hypothetical protein